MDGTGMIENSEASGTRIRHRLGIVGLPGFAPVPHLLFLHQADLGLTAEELSAFLNIFMHWHDAGRMPFVHTATIAKRMGISARKAARIVRSLKTKGMLLRVPGEKKKDPKRYDVRLLLLMLEPYAKKWIALRKLKQQESMTSVQNDFFSEPQAA